MTCSKNSVVGVGLRYPHYEMALNGSSSIDFVEVHAENFFAEGGITAVLLDDIRSHYKLSLHGTALGLGSAMGVNEHYLERLKHLVERSDPWLLSDHAAFTWSRFNHQDVHAGDLLPLEFSHQAMTVMAENVDRVQQRLGQKILVENISQYVTFHPATLSETEFLVSLVERTQCGLLVDLNNLLVNAHNAGCDDPLSYAKAWLREIPPHSIGEFHLAGSTPVAASEILVDDHAQPVTDSGWSLFRFATELAGPRPTLIEWDNQLPTWPELVQQAERARAIIHEVHTDAH